jgi:hypothetical protein
MWFVSDLLKSLYYQIRFPRQSVYSIVSPPGHGTNHTLLNVVRSKGPGRIRDALLIDNLETRVDSDLADDDDDDKYYHAQDFDIGLTLAIGGRDIFLFACDEYTRKIYKDTFDRELSTIKQERRELDVSEI